MSRALDKDTKRALEDGDHSFVYGELSSLLAIRAGPGVSLMSPPAALQIELLGASHPLTDGVSYIQDEEDEKYVAIPKVRIVQAFIVARRHFLELMEQAKRSGQIRSRPTELATAVMLLMDPEHLTAANMRKRVLKQSMEICDLPTIQKLLEHEMWLLKSLLTSHLHRHTKSPTLWSHRRWVVQQLGKRHVKAEGSLKNTLIEEIFVSAERHPRNYYAWSHARFLLETNWGISEETDLLGVLGATKDWCFKHHDDVSGWMFLLSVLRRVQGEKRLVGSKLASETESEDVFDETVKLATAFRWRNESVWYFLRNLVSSGLVGDERKKGFKAALEQLEKGASATDGAILRSTEAWVEKWTHTA